MDILVIFMYNDIISFPLKTAVADHTGQMTWGDTEPYLAEVLSLNTYWDPINIISYITCILPLLEDDYFSHYQMCDWASDTIIDD